LLAEQLPERVDTAGVDRLDQGPGRRIILRQPQTTIAMIVRNYGHDVSFTARWSACQGPEIAT
jgi:hypothetical protein